MSNDLQKNITAQEIETLYKICGINANDNVIPLTSINTGNLHNKLNHNFNSLYKPTFLRWQ